MATSEERKAEDEEDDDSDNERSPMDPESENIVASIDATTTVINRSWPPALFGFYRSLIDEGFCEQRAFDLTQDYMVNILPDMEVR